MNNGKKLLLIILDGFGVGEDYAGNAITRAKTPNLDKLLASAPNMLLQCSGESVGLPPGQMGTSEVNHLTIGSGRVLFQELVKINKSINDETFYHNEAFIQTFEHVKQHGGVLHVQGLVSDGGVHSHQEHLLALIRAAKSYGLEKVYVHVFSDGRDTLPKSAKKYVAWLQVELEKIGLGKIASISGRYFAMDRDHNWDRVDKAFNMIMGEVPASEQKVYRDPVEAIEAAYEGGVTDEFIEPVYIEVEPGELGTIATGDGVIFANFRSDRARQMTERLLGVRQEKELDLATMTAYSQDYDVRVAFPTEDMSHILTDVLAENGVSQLRITETEKFNHLTYFFNAKRDSAAEKEDRMMLDSYSDIKTHDERPEMRARDITKQILMDMAFSNHQVIITNLCNADMVGHTGNFEAIVKAVEVLDECLGQILEIAAQNDYEILITADHGNAEETKDKTTSETLTAHTTNPVPFILVSPRFEKLAKTEGTLADIAPTMLKMLDIEVPAEMTGTSLV
jgi:2,3-bisphosphoglycerate-independent phosphoglycerate mutase